MSQIFKILFQAGDVHIFILCCVLFSAHVQLKSLFSGGKIVNGNIWDTL